MSLCGCVISLYQISASSADRSPNIGWNAKIVQLLLQGLREDESIAKHEGYWVLSDKEGEMVPYTQQASTQ